MESVQTINGTLFSKMVLAGCNNLKAHAQEVNDLNVFPIPDGDTGSNMLMTITGGANTINKSYENLSEASRDISNGMLLSARGNSGVILSQIFDGIADGFEGVDCADNQTIINAFQKGVQNSYNSVMEPTEGTLLTVMRCATESIADKSFDNPQMLMQNFLTEAKRTLKKTPEMLPVLKKAGVVDSGGAGLIYIMEGMLNVLNGSDVSSTDNTLEPEDNNCDIDLFTEDSVLEYGYCTEILLRLQKCKINLEAFEIKTLTEYLKQIGDSVVTFKSGSIVKIHVHTFTPDKVLSYCQKYGEFLKVKIENMSLQHNNIAIDDIRSTKQIATERKPYATVTVASGDGIRQLFADCGADIVINGGQCMNPSTEDFLNAFDEANADTIFVLPNNKNIILAAKQAAEMYKKSDVRIICSNSIGDGYAALSMMSYDSNDANEIAKLLNEAMQGVITATVSKSVRTTDSVQAGDYIGFIDKKIIAKSKRKSDTLKATVDAIDIKDYSVGILIHGKETNEKDAENAKKYISTNYPELEICVVNGMQDIYDYILILE